MADITELPADRCASPSDVDCIRAVYRGAPGDYAQVTDIPASALVAPASDGRYEVQGGQRITVVTAAPLPEGRTRFYLTRDAVGASAPVGDDQLILRVGTTYTFTPATPGEGATIVSFELMAGTAPSEEGAEPEFGDVVVRTTFQVTAPHWTGSGPRGTRSRERRRWAAAVAAVPARRRRRGLQPRGRGGWQC